MYCFFFMWRHSDHTWTSIWRQLEPQMASTVSRLRRKWIPVATACRSRSLRLKDTLADLSPHRELVSPPRVSAPVSEGQLPGDLSAAQSGESCVTGRDRWGRACSWGRWGSSLAGFQHDGDAGGGSRGCESGYGKVWKERVEVSQDASMPLKPRYQWGQHGGEMPKEGKWFHNQIVGQN